MVTGINLNSKKIIIIGLVVIIILIAIYTVIKCSNRSKLHEPQSIKMPMSTMPSFETKQSGLKMDPKLQLYKDLIFKTQIMDVKLNDDITTEPVYSEIMPALTKYFETPTSKFPKPPPPTKEQITFLIKYKKFLDMDDVYSMCSEKEVDQLYLVLLNVISNKIEGDIVETGVWRGGMVFFVQAMLAHFGEKKRQVWGFDAFDKFPKPEISPFNDSQEINEKDSTIHALTQIMYSHPPKLKDVEFNFKKLGLFDSNVHLVKGLFSKTIPENIDAIQKISVLRIDNDYYDSVYYILESLYFKIQPGGYVILDDYNNPVIGCKDAVIDFRLKHGIVNEIIDTYGGSIYWKI